MKTTKLFFMAALALTFAACSNDDNDFENPAQQPAEAQGIPFTATISMGGDKATTRALSDNGSGLTATWTVDEEVALIHNGIIDKVTVASVDGNVATISGTITTDADGADVTVIFPYSAVDLDTKDVKAGLLTAQDGGTLADVAAKYDVRKGYGTLKVSGTASLNDDVTLNNQFAIMKLTLANNAKNLSIMAGDITIAGATLGTAGTEFTVAVPAVSSKTVTIVANDESNNYYYFSKDGVTIDAGKYYQSAPTMTAIGTSSSANEYMITGNVSTQTIGAGKTVVLYNVTISNGQIACSGNANMILLGANKVTATDKGKAAIKIGGSGTLTITGSGSLTAQGGQSAAGIGTNKNETGGNIEINGGTVNATGGNDGAGIGTGRVEGSSSSITCGDITINGGTVTAQGGKSAAGIGTGLSTSDARITCGAITIGTGVTMVTATKGTDSPNSIGKGKESMGGSQTCGTITIGGTIYWDGSAYQNGGDTYLVNNITYPTAP